MCAIQYMKYRNTNIQTIYINLSLIHEKFGIFYMNSSINDVKYTSDLKPMIRIGIFNSLGFFFLDFLIPYVAFVIIKASGTEMGILFSVRTIGYLTFAPIAGSLADKYSKKMLVTLGSIGRGIGYFVLYISIVIESLPLIIAGNLLLGLMVGFYWIPLDALVSEKSNPDNRAEALGLRNSIQGIGIMIGAALGFAIIGYTSTVTPDNNALIYSALIIYGLANIYGGLRFYLTVDEKIKFEEEQVSNKEVITYLEFFKSMPKTLLTGFTTLLIAMFLSSTNASISKPFILVYLTKNIVTDPTMASAAFAPAGIVSMLFAPKLGAIADSLNQKLVISASAILGGALTWWLINTDSLLLFSFILILDSTVATTAGLMITNIFSKISIKNRGKVFGIVTIASDVGGIFGPIFGGILWELKGDKSPFIFSIFAELLLIPVYILAIVKLMDSVKKEKNVKIITSQAVYL